jgi:hypothetical protein
VAVVQQVAVWSKAVCAIAPTGCVQVQPSSAAT